MNHSVKSLQELHAPSSICFGCGPANTQGLRIRSLVDGDKVIAHWTPEKHHEAFPNVLNGGIIGALLDCHCNWAAAWHLMNKASLDHPPCTVTAEYSIKLLAPTPTNGEILLEARILESGDRSVKVEGKLIAEGKPTALCTGTFVSVKPGHPAYYRW
jgi:acyl-coenzyme A thioesterase PaaI-like protein